MPAPGEILQQLGVIANEHEGLAIAWHIAIIAGAVLVLRRRLSADRASLLVLAPIVSVLLVAAVHYSWFNAISFGVLAIALAGARDDLPPRKRTNVPVWSTVLGVLLVAFALWYPHFTQGPWYRSLYAAPVGLVPCPTLALVAGFTLVEGGFGSRAIPALLAGWTAFYAAVGIFALGVDLDFMLFVATAGLVRIAMRNAHAWPRWCTTSP